MSALVHAAAKPPAGEQKGASQKPTEPKERQRTTTTTTTTTTSRPIENAEKDFSETQLNMISKNSTSPRSGGELYYSHLVEPRKLGKLPFSLLLMEINESRRTRDPKQRLKQEVETNQAKKTSGGGQGVSEAHRPPHLPNPPDAKKAEDKKAKKLFDPPEAPPAGLCYKEQIVDEVVVCPKGYNVTLAHVCRMIGDPVLTCPAVRARESARTSNRLVWETGLP